MAKKTPDKTNRNVVWPPPSRRRVLVKGVDERLKEVIYAVADELGCEVLALEIMPDHVHLLCAVDPQCGVQRFVNRVKGRSSSVLRQWLKSRLPTLAAHRCEASGNTLRVRRTYKYRRSRCDKRDRQRPDQINSAGIIWNHGVALQRRYYRMTGQSINVNRLMKHIAQLRRPCRMCASAWIKPSSAFSLDRVDDRASRR